MTKNKKTVSILLLFIIFCLFFRIDFRFKNSVECCSDDFDYFSHAETIAIDRDFDYTNQLPDYHPFVFKYDGKIAPVGFPGSGILSSPFVFIGNTLDNLLNIDQDNDILNYKLLLYSISPIFYFFISYILLFKSLSILNIESNKYLMLLLISGSGITYFAFERFSMTHVFEMFTVSFLIWNSVRFYKNRNNTSGFLIPLSLLIAFLVRMSNFYVFLIPLIIKNLVKTRHRKKFSLLRNYYFIGSSIISTYFYTILSNKIYGKIIFNPQEVYGTNLSVNDVISNENSLLALFIDIFRTSFKIFFGNEFGIFWISPIIFVGLFLILSDFKNLRKPFNLLLLMCFAQNFAIVYIWKSTAASYGFRYLYSLVPLCVLIYFQYKDKEINKYLLNYALIMSIFSNLSILFFETTEKTQLSTTEIANSFGLIRNYVEPEYVTGVLGSFLELNSYLIIFTTSLLGVLVFKTLILFFGSEAILELLTNLGLPTENQDFINYLNNLEIISTNKLILITVFLLFFSYYIVFRLKFEKS